MASSRSVEACSPESEHSVSHPAEAEAPEFNTGGRKQTTSRPNSHRHCAKETARCTPARSAGIISHFRLWRGSLRRQRVVALRMRSEQAAGCVVLRARGAFDTHFHIEGVSSCLRSKTRYSMGGNNFVLTGGARNV